MTIMTAATTHAGLQAWVDEVAALTTPDQVVWSDGSDEEWQRLTQELVDAGTFVKLDEDKKPNSFWAASDPSDVARVEDRTFICSAEPEGAGFTNNWKAPAEMKALMTDLYRGCMTGRTMYVIPFVMGHLNADTPMYGVEITDSAYVVVSMKIMARIGTEVLRAMEASDAGFVKGLHSVGFPLPEGTADVKWPCSDTKYIAHFPETREIWSYGSGYGGNALLGKKCYALRIASAMARDEGWMAEHMLILKLTSPEGRTHYIAGAFPSACGKTNLAMIDPTLEGWSAEMVGDDIAWMRFGKDGRLYAVNPEFGLFGVAPGTGDHTNPNAMRTVEKGNSIFTNVALTDDGDVWWEGMTEQPPAHLTDWKGRDWTPDNGELSSHPNSRFCTPAKQPFIGYNAADYVGHWLDIGKQADASKLPKIYQVNWFRRDVNEDGTAGKFLWPGFGDNARVLKWVIERLDGTGEGVDTPVGIVPAPGALDVSGLDMTDEDIAKALAVNADEWAVELGLIEEWLAKFGESLPTQMQDELATLKANLGR